VPVARASKGVYGNDNEQQSRSALIPPTRALSGGTARGREHVLEGRNGELRLARRAVTHMCYQLDEIFWTSRAPTAASSGCEFASGTTATFTALGVRRWSESSLKDKHGPAGNKG